MLACTHTSLPIHHQAVPFLLSIVSTFAKHHHPHPLPSPLIDSSRLVKKVKSSIDRLQLEWILFLQQTTRAWSHLKDLRQKESVGQASYIKVEKMSRSLSHLLAIKLRPSSVKTSYTPLFIYVLRMTDRPSGDILAWEIKLPREYDSTFQFTLFSKRIEQHQLTSNTSFLPLSSPWQQQLNSFKYLGLNYLATTTLTLSHLFPTDW